MIHVIQLYLARMDTCPREEWCRIEDSVSIAKDVLALLSVE